MRTSTPPTTKQTMGMFEVTDSAYLAHGLISWTGVKVHKFIYYRLFKNCIILQIAFIFYSKCFR